MKTHELNRVFWILEVDQAKQYLRLNLDQWMPELSRPSCS